jgi:hypothetical protein
VDATLEANPGSDENKKIWALCCSFNGIRAREEVLALIQRRERRKYFLPELLFLRWDLLLAQETVPWRF